MPDVSDPYASLPDDGEEPNHWVLDLPDDYYSDEYVDHLPAIQRQRPLRLRPFDCLDEPFGMRTLN